LNETKWIDAWYFCDACRGGPPQESAGFCPGCGKEKLQDTPAEKE
jgi:rRNA maturation endonuclease Nob1